MRKKLKYFLIGISIVLLIALMIVGAIFIRKQTAIYPEADKIEATLKQEWNTVWSDETDGIIRDYNKGGCQVDANGKIIECSTDKFTYSPFFVETRGESWDAIVLTTPRDRSANVLLKQNLYGQEIVLLVTDFGTGFRLFGNSFDSGNIGIQNVNGNANYGTLNIIQIKPHTLDNTKIDIINGGVVRKTISSISNPFYIELIVGSEASGVWHFIGSNPSQSCKISKDEVWLTERYGSKVVIDDLTYSPVHLCYDEKPPLLRTSEGVDKIYPDPFPSFIKKNSIPQERELETGEQVEISYSAYFVSGVIDPLPPNKEYFCVERNADNKCSKWIVRDYVLPLEIPTQQCKIDDDCPRPLKNLCPNYFVGCTNNNCTYDESQLTTPVCKQELITIIETQKKLERTFVFDREADNVFIYRQTENKPTLSIGNKVFAPSQAQFNCEFPPDVDIVSHPNPDSSCYSVRINYDSRQLEFKHHEEQILEEVDGQEILRAKYIAGGELRRRDEGIENRLTNEFVFVASNGLDFTINDTKQILRNSNQKIKLVLTNNLPDGEVLVRTRQRIETIGRNLPEKKIVFPVKHGKNEILLERDSTNSGINSFEIAVFYLIQSNSEELIPANQEKGFYFEVVDEVPKIQKPVEITITKENIKEKTVFRIPSYVWWLIGALIIITVILVFLLLKRKNKKKR